MLFISACVSAGSSTLVLSRCMRPWRRSTGGWPTVMCRSLAPCFTHAESNLSMRIVPMVRSFPCYESVGDKPATDTPNTHR